MHEKKPLERLFSMSKLAFYIIIGKYENNIFSEVFMNSSMIIEAVGYLGSALVLVSFLMVSVRKLRIVNSIGSVIFTVYAFIIHSYPTAIMNLCLVIINIYHLVKMGNTSENTRNYDLVEVSPEDGMLRYTVDRCKDDIEKCFPGIDLALNKANLAYLICYQGSPAGVFAGNRNDDNSFDILLDYSLPEFRDFSIGDFIFSKLPAKGITSLTYNGPDEYHKDYLKKYDFVKKENGYLKTL